MFKEAPYLTISGIMVICVILYIIIGVIYAALSIMPLVAMILALEASTKIHQRIYQPHEWKFFLYIRCLIPAILNILALFIYCNYIDYIIRPGDRIVQEAAIYIKMAFFLQACFFGSVTFCFVKGVNQRRREENNRK